MGIRYLIVLLIMTIMPHSQEQSVIIQYIKDYMQDHNNISFRALTKEDVSLLSTWFLEAHVCRWWPILKKDEAIEVFLKRIRSKDTFGYIINLDGKPIGYIQYYCVDPTEVKTKPLPGLPLGTIGTDQFIGDPSYIGKGIGTRMIKEFIAYLCTIKPGIPMIIVDPDPENHAAIRCYEKVGFKRDGIYKMDYGNCLLMKYDSGKCKIASN